MGTAEWCFVGLTIGVLLLFTELMGVARASANLHRELLGKLRIKARGTDGPQREG